MECLRKTICRNLDELGVSRSLAGFPQLADAIELVCEWGLDPRPKIMAVYHAVAKKRNTSAQCVERNIRYCTNEIFRYSEPDELLERYGRSMRKNIASIKNGWFMCAEAAVILRQRELMMEKEGDET